MKKFAYLAATVFIIGVALVILRNAAPDVWDSIWRFFFGDDGSGLFGRWMTDNGP